MKWVLGVHRKTNNNFCYGDTGRKPWAIDVLQQCFRYFNRISSVSSTSPSDVNFLVHQAFCEQRNLDLSWYNRWQSVITNHRDNQQISDTFIKDWKADLLTQSKMGFYQTLKNDFAEEQYLSLKSWASRVSITRLRSSSHDLRIERGRYTKDGSKLSTRSCRFCCDIDNIEGLEALLFAESPFLETEEHCLTECPAYQPARATLSNNLKSLIMLKEYGAIMQSEHVKEFGLFLTKCFRIRNPKQQ